MNERQPRTPSRVDAPLLAAWHLQNQRSRTQVDDSLRWMLDSATPPPVGNGARIEAGFLLRHADTHYAGNRDRPMPATTARVRPWPRRNSLEDGSKVRRESCSACRAEESAIVEMRLRLCDQVRSKRLSLGITQQELAARIESTQPRVAKLERGEASFEMMLLALLALGASRRVIARVLAEG